MLIICFKHTFAEHTGGKELRIATNHLFFLAICLVGEIHIILQNLHKACRLVCTCNDSLYLVDTTLCSRVFVVHFLPSIIVLVWCVCCTQLCVIHGSITYARKRAKTQKVWNIPFVANMYLVVSIGNSSILVCRVF